MTPEATRLLNAAIPSIYATSAIVTALEGELTSYRNEQDPLQKEASLRRYEKLFSAYDVLQNIAGELTIAAIKADKP